MLYYYITVIRIDFSGRERFQLLGFTLSKINRKLKIKAQRNIGLNLVQTGFINIQVLGGTNGNTTMLN